MTTAEDRSPHLLALPRENARLLARARARRRQRGASMFVVAITLGLLGAMGVYGLNSTASDFRAVSHLREGLHAQRASESAMTIAAEAFNPMTGPKLLEDLTGSAADASKCKKSAAARVATSAVSGLNAQACLTLTLDELKIIINGAMGGSGNWGTATPFTSESFFPVTTGEPAGALTPEVFVEVSNPGESATPPGWDQNKDLFYEVTVTPVTRMVAAGTNGATQSTAIGRARVVVGPARPMRALTKPVTP